MEDRRSKRGQAFRERETGGPKKGRRCKEDHKAKEGDSSVKGGYPDTNTSLEKGVSSGEWTPSWFSSDCSYSLISPPPLLCDLPRTPSPWPDQVASFSVLVSLSDMVNFSRLLSFSELVPSFGLRSSLRPLPSSGLVIFSVVFLSSELLSSSQLLLSLNLARLCGRLFSSQLHPYSAWTPLTSDKHRASVILLYSAFFTIHNHSYKALAQPSPPARRTIRHDALC